MVLMVYVCFCIGFSVLNIYVISSTLGHEHTSRRSIYEVRHIGGEAKERGTRV